MDTIKAFISYSWDNQEHKDWVKRFATDLRGHGVDVILDQWDARLGDDLSLFMEKGLTSSHLVICVCSEQYVKKANEGKGGTGYEKRILSAEMINNDNKRYIIPIIKNNPGDKKVPTFLSAFLYEDFDNSGYPDSYKHVIARIYNEDFNTKPPLGHNPFDVTFLSEQISVKLNLEENEFHNPNISGIVSFDYKKHDGVYTIGFGINEFVTKWSEAGSDSVYCYRDKVSRIGYKAGAIDFPKLKDIANDFDFSSRVKIVSIGEVVILENKNHRFAAIKVLQVHRAKSDIGHCVEFEYMIYGPELSVES